MLKYFKVDQNGLKEAQGQDHNIILLEEEHDPKYTDQLIEKYDLPNDLFLGSNLPEEVTRLEHLEGTKLNNPTSLVLMDLSANMEHSIEERLQPLSFIKSDELLILHICENSDFFERLLEKFGPQITNYTEFVAWSIFQISTHFLKDLQERKKIIDDLENSAKTTAKNEELFRMIDAERNMTYLQETLNNQHSTLKELFEETDFVAELDNAGLIYDIQLRDRQAKKMVDVYTSLMENISGLFTDMMNNNLNHLMKYLDSLSIVLSVPALIGTIWGMNAGGLLFKKSSYGFLIILAISIILGALMALHLYKKDYSK
ncbi:mit family metal ion transporter cora [Amylolactobacillus amylotrophicus DSM 20534]|uniref:Uncharacterized protein n=3 Tax=Amylolactobacillus TaxID=2767876 RepID=A0A1L6XB00_9LACO|nr:MULTISPECIES: magnesium transporter CorA family protein [Amylolactobacillus]APT18148.1 hypothetical protein LA20533_02125 [Amylolactobacillus amylophilus DSM 20533 = JCM 1125]KRK37915.1 mit family metal ion transporter cora [Amylolactobacillus amylotrophicus DSM 20534]KRM42175.1 mit family metal ion transporter cora [Amylolactobacillus amylophilus DSM 20533 = JCM 1125]GED80272.1 magnesium transporter [Amylolactobacillus amylophilus]